MNTVVAGIWVMASLIIGTLILSYAVFGTGLVQGETIKGLGELQGERMRTAIRLEGDATITPTSITLTVENEGSTTVTPMEKMDVYVQYTAAGGNPVAEGLSYATAGPGAGEWLLSSLSPDGYNPGLWDPEEEATLSLEVSNPIQAGSLVTVVVSTPNGVTTSRSWTYTP